MFTMPEYGLNMSIGRVTTLSAAKISQESINACDGFYDILDCKNIAEETSATSHNSYTEGRVTINNITLASYFCASSTHYFVYPVYGGMYGPHNFAAPGGYNDALCCTN